MRMKGDDLLGRARGQVDATPALLRAEGRVSEDELARQERASFGVQLEQWLRLEEICGVGRAGLKELMEGDTEGLEYAVLCVQAMNCAAAQDEPVAHTVLREGKIVRGECGIKRGQGPGAKPGVTKRVPLRS
ncbi:MAG: hypothetical protein WCC53_10580 [Thermoanaerobaculia bacterium]